MNTASTVELVVRCPRDDKGNHRDVHLHVSPDAPLGEIRRRLAKEGDTNPSSIALSLQGQTLTDNEQTTLRQAYGNRSFAIPLDARIVVAQSTGTTSPSRPPVPVSFEYVDLPKISTKLFCSICTQPAVELRVHPRCNTLFCLGCIAQWLASSDTCPTCRQASTPDDFQPNLFTQGLLNELAVYCSNRSRACEWTGERGSLAEHLDRFCAFSPCSLAGCPWLGVLRERPDHLDTVCEYAEVLCPEGCGEPMERRAVPEHVRSLCAEVQRKEEERQREAARRAEAEVKRQQEQRAKDLEALCDQLNPPPEDVLTLNVGGTLFSTSRATLTKYPMSVLGVMFSAGSRRKLKCNSKGVVFLDAPARPFGYVLAWLQEAVFPTDLGSYDTELLLQHARRWKLDELVAVLGGQEASARKGGGPLLSQGDVLNYMQIAGCATGGQLSLSGANLSGLYLGGARLEKAIFTGATLRRTNFGCANLSGSDLSRADLRDADMGHANLTSTNLTNANLTNANLTNADLTNANLTNAKLPLNLSGVNLTGVDLSGRDLTNADLTNANLTNANLANANLPLNLSGVNLTGVDLSGRDLTNADLTNADLTNANLTNAKLPLNLSGVNLTGVDLSGRDLANANLANANLANANLTNASLANANLPLNLSGVNLTGADLSGRDLTNANLTNADLTNADLTNAKLPRNVSSVDLTNGEMVRPCMRMVAENAKACQKGLHVAA